MRSSRSSIPSLFLCSVLTIPEVTGGIKIQIESAPSGFFKVSPAELLLQLVIDHGGENVNSARGSSFRCHAVGECLLCRLSTGGATKYPPWPQGLLPTKGRGPGR